MTAQLSAQEDGERKVLINMVVHASNQAVGKKNKIYTFQTNWVSNKWVLFGLSREKTTWQFCTWKKGSQLRALICSSSAFGIIGSVLTVKYAEQNPGSCGKIMHNTESILIY